MKCSKCLNNISEEIKCLLCEEYFCSKKCMEMHITSSHNKEKKLNEKKINNNLNNKKKSNSHIEKKTEKEKTIHSPYIIQGILNIKRTYDEKYNLNNFVKITENSKPIIIGGGSFGQVYLVKNKINKKLYAIKHMEKKLLAEKLNNLDGIYKEIYIQSRIDHPNILPILFVSETVSDFDLVLEYAPYGSLFYFIRKNKRLNEPLTFSLYIQVVNAVYFLHKNNLIHRDIKPENILIFNNNIIKLCDFGWCAKLEEGQQRVTFCGTTEYMSPELVNHEEYSKEIDVWSLGILLYEMVHGHSPFRPDKPKFQPKDVIQNIRRHNLKFSKKVSEECKELIYHLLEQDPNKRIKVEDIFHSDFVKYYEKMRFGFPDSYLVEKYKFKLAKVKNMLHSENINKNNNKPNGNNDDKENKDMKKNIDLNKLKVIYKKKRKNKYIIQNSLSDTNLINKLGEKKLTKNKTSQNFHSINNEDDKIYSRNIELKSDILNKKITKEKLDLKKEKNNPKVENYKAKIKTILINNYFFNNNNKAKKANKANKEKLSNNFINIEENNDENDKNKSYKKNSHIKPLKISKIPINTKKFHHAHSPTSIINSIINKNYLVFKKNISPKNKLNNKNKSSSFKKNKENEKKIIEVLKSKCLRSPQLYINNDIKKAYTRNNLKANCDVIKIKCNSDENFTNTNVYTNTNNSCTNNSFNYNLINNEEILEQKMKNKKLYCTKSLNHLKRNINGNIKSMFINNIKYHIISNINNINNNHNNTMTDENKKRNNFSNTHKLNKKGKSFHIIKRINSSINSFKNSPLITYNNNFVVSNFNKNQNRTGNNCKDIISPNISYHIIKNNSYSGNKNNYFISKSKIENLKENNLNRNKKKLFSKKKLLKNNSPSKQTNNNFNEYTKNKINLNQILKDKEASKNNKVNRNNILEKNSKYLNSVILYPIKTSPKYKMKKNNSNINNISNIDKKQIKNSKLISLKRNGLSSKKSKNEYNINSNRSNNIIFSTNSSRINLKRKKNNAGMGAGIAKGCRAIIKNQNTYKNKIIKKLEINEFLNNIKLGKNKKKINTSVNTENNLNKCNLSFNHKISRCNTSIYDKKWDEYYDNNNNNKNNNLDKQKCELDNQNSMSLRMKNNKFSLYSRNYYEDGNDKQIRKIFINNKTLNLDNKKLKVKKEPKILINSLFQKHKKGYQINRNENFNYINNNSNNEDIIIGNGINRNKIKYY